MPNSIPAFVLASGIWVICIAAYNMETPRRPPGEAWIVTSSEKMPSRPMLVRAHVSFRTAAR